MRLDSENDLRDLLSLYVVKDPERDMVFEVTHHMREEMQRVAPSSLQKSGWVLLFLGFILLVAVSIFYMLTIGTVLIFMLPAYLNDFFIHSLIVFTAVGGILITGSLLLVYFRELHSPRLEVR
jgi:uncharacterized integral membrane protein